MQEAEYVYFVRSAQQNAVKVGIARDVRARIAGLQTGNPNRLELVGAIPGGRHAELFLHRLLGEKRLVGEWFEIDDAVNVVLSLVPPFQDTPPAVEAALARSDARSYREGQLVALSRDIERVRREGARTLRQICAELERQEVPAPKDDRWHAGSLSRLMRDIRNLRADRQDAETER